MGTHRLPQVALRSGTILLLAVALGTAGGPTDAQNPTAKASKEDAKAADDNPMDRVALTKLLSGLPQVTFDDQGTPRRFYVWDGDMLLDQDEVQSMLIARRIRQGPVRQGELLLQIRGDGQPGIWSRAKRKLTWAIDCSTFRSASECNQTATAMASAAHDWETVCPSCQIKFRRVNAVSGIKAADGTGPNFVVRYNPDTADYIAISFFANDPAYKRYLLVTSDYFTSEFDRVGVLRHELGHVLGYRHEHNEAPSGCYFEDNQWRPLTPYDPKSVMHYLCGGGGTTSLQFTASDKDGHRRAYGG